MNGAASRQDEVEQNGSDTQVETPPGNSEASDRSSKPLEWRRIAKLMEQETDPSKLMDLAQKLIEEFDSVQRPGLSPTPRAVEATGVRAFEAQQESSTPHLETAGNSTPD